MNLASPPAKYDAADQAKVRAELQRSDGETFKKGRDVELARGERLILRSVNGDRWAVTVSNTGVLSTAGPL